MNKQVKRVSDCPLERLAHCRGEGSPTGVKTYHVCDTGLAEGVALGRITVVLGADFDRVRAERDALQLLLNVADQRVCDLQTDLTKVREPIAQYQCEHEWIDDGEFTLVCTVCGAQENHDPQWQDMDYAPKDGTLLRLLVEFDEHSTEDAEQAPTIGSNNFDNDGEDQWTFAGWCWTHDHWVQGKGKPVGWLPMFDARQSAPVANSYPECSGVPNDCPQNEGNGCGCSAEVCQFPQSCTTMCGCKPDAAAADDRSYSEHICPGCGSKGWQAHCERCIPF